MVDLTRPMHATQASLPAQKIRVQKATASFALISERLGWRQLWRHLLTDLIYSSKSSALAVSFSYCIRYIRRPCLTLFLAIYPETLHTLGEIGRYINSIKSHGSGPSLSFNQVEPQQKKRKLGDVAEDASTWEIIQSYKDISFSIPQRKKLKLEIGGLPGQGLKGVATGGDVESLVTWSQIREIFCLPVPEKSQAQYNFALFLAGTDGGSDQVLWTVPETVPKSGAISPAPPPSSEQTYRSHLLATINQILAKRRRAITVPMEGEFASQIVQSHRKNEKAYHVKAFRGAKDGFLFFLSNGIFWGFKKPLEFFPFDTIESVSYTSVLQRTFNLNVIARPSSTDPPSEFEFSMVDQEDFAGIDAYIKRHQLHDASMAEQRRAKKVNVNGTKCGQGAGEDGEDAEGELQKAAREAKHVEDDEDDEEDDENFDPGSEGESEGEGTSSDEEEDQTA